MSYVEIPAVIYTYLFTSSGICALVVALIFERDGVTGELNGELVLGVAYLAVCCTAIALFFQNFGQKYTEPSTASLLLSLESVFGVIFSAAMGREELNQKIIIGFVLIFAAVVISETKLSFLHKRKTE